MQEENFFNDLITSPPEWYGAVPSRPMRPTAAPMGKKRTQGGYLLLQHRRTFPKRSTQVLLPRDHWEKQKILGEWRRTEFTATRTHISVNLIPACSVTLTEIPAVALPIFRADPVDL